MIRCTFIYSPCVLGEDNAALICAHYQHSLKAAVTFIPAGDSYSGFLFSSCAKKLIFQIVYAPAKKMRDFKGSIPLTLGFQ